MEVTTQCHAPASLFSGKEPPAPTVAPKTGMDAVVRRKNSLHCPCRESNPNRSTRGLVTYWLYYARSKSLHIRRYSYIRTIRKSHKAYVYGITIYIYIYIYIYCSYNHTCKYASNARDSSLYTRINGTQLTPLLL
jgi:hypothetical protein